MNNIDRFFKLPVNPDKRVENNNICAIQLKD